MTTADTAPKPSRLADIAYWSLEVARWVALTAWAAAMILMVTRRDHDNHWLLAGVAAFIVGVIVTEVQGLFVDDDETDEQDDEVAS